MGITNIETGPIVQSSGEASLAFAHHEIYGGARLYLGGFLLQGTYFNMEQIVDNSLLVPILGGGSVQLTNNHKASRVTFSTIRTSSHKNLAVAGAEVSYGLDPLDKNGNKSTSADDAFDIVSIAELLKDLPGGDSWGGSFQVKMGFNGFVFSIILKRCTLVRSTPLILSGNDVPAYQTIFNVGKYLIEPEDYGTWDTGNAITKEKDEPGAWTPEGSAYVSAGASA